VNRYCVQFIATLRVEPAVHRSPHALRDPTYYLYHHATELVLKACLLSHDLHKTGRHNIGALFELCRTNKFLGLNDDHFELHGLIVLLEGVRMKRDGIAAVIAGSFKLLCPLARAFNPKERWLEQQP
jgi:hypothetical protein